MNEQVPKEKLFSVPALSMQDVQAIVLAAKAEGVPVVIVNGPLVIQQASGGGASNVAFGEPRS